MNTIPNSIRIAIAMMKPVGDTIEERFKSVITLEVLSSACFACGTEDEQFRAAVGAVMMSYGPGTPEFERLEREMRALQQLTALITSAQAGVRVTGVEETWNDVQPVGLMRMWHERER